MNINDSILVRFSFLLSPRKQFPLIGPDHKEVLAFIDEIPFPWNLDIMAPHRLGSHGGIGSISVFVSTTGGISVNFLHLKSDGGVAPAYDLPLPSPSQPLSVFLKAFTDSFDTLTSNEANTMLYWLKSFLK